MTPNYSAIKSYWALQFVLSAFPHVVGKPLCLFLFRRAAHEAWVLVSTISRFWWTPPCAIFSLCTLNPQMPWFCSDTLYYMPETTYARFDLGPCSGACSVSCFLERLWHFWPFWLVQASLKNPRSALTCCKHILACTGMVQAGFEAKLAPCSCSGVSPQVSFSHFWLSSPFSYFQKILRAYCYYLTMLCSVMPYASMLWYVWK